MKKKILRGAKGLILTAKKNAQGVYTTAGVAAGSLLASSQSMAEFTAPAEATAAVADVSSAITWAIGVGYTLAALALVGVVGIGLFKKYVKKGAS